MPSKVRVDASSRAPSAPAITTLFSVKSLTVADDRTVSAPEKFAPALPSTKAANVDTPEALKLSTSVCPTTSNPIPPEMCAPALASIAPAYVDTPDTLTSSNSACPTTFKPTPPEISAPPLASTAPVNVDTPVITNPPTPVTCALEATKFAIVPNEVTFG